MPHNFRRRIPDHYRKLFAAIALGLAIAAFIVAIFGSNPIPFIAGAIAFACLSVDRFLDLARIVEAWSVRKRKDDDEADGG